MCFVTRKYLMWTSCHFIHILHYVVTCARFGTCPTDQNSIGSKSSDLVISVSKKEYMTANCNPRPSLQVYGPHQPCYWLQISWLQNDISCKWPIKAQGVAMEWFLETEKKIVERFPTIHLCESEVILHHLYDNFSRWLWILGLISRHGKQNQHLCHLLRQDHPWDINQYDFISNIAIYSMTNTKPLVYHARKRQLGFLGNIRRLPEVEPARRYALIVCTTSRQKESRSSTHLLHHIHPMGVRIHEVEISADEKATLVEDRCAWRNLVIAYSAAEGWWWWWWHLFSRLLLGYLLLICKWKCGLWKMLVRTEDDATLKGCIMRGCVIVILWAW